MSALLCLCPPFFVCVCPPFLHPRPLCLQHKIIAKIALDTIAAPCYNNPTTLNFGRPQPFGYSIWLYDLLLRLVLCGGSYVFTFCAPSFVRPVVCAPRRLCAPSFVRPVVCAPRRLCAPSFVLLMASLLASLLLTAPDARAGSYVVTYSGGTASVTGQGTASQFSPGEDKYAASEYASSGSNSDGSPLSFSLKINGPLTATFTWTHGSGETDDNDPPPASALVEQDCSASYNISASGYDASGSGSANSGLPGAVTATEFPGGGSDNTNYSVGAGGASFTATCNPSVTCSGGNGGQSCSYTTGTALVVYHAVAYAATLSVGGTTPDSSGNPNILVGQQATGTVFVVTPNNQPSPCGLSNFQWNVSGTTFESWGVASDANNQSHTVKVDAIPATNPTQWYWNDLANASETVKCTVTVAPPANQGSPFNLTVTAPKPVSVWVPGWSCSGNGGTMQINSLHGGGNAGDLWLYAGPASGSTTGRGMDWTATVSASAAPVPFGTGVLEMVQTETPNSTYTSTAGIKYKRSNNGQQGLDSAYPYPWQSPPPSPPSYESGDSPGIDLTLLSAASGQLQYQFVDCLMYEPPGSTQFVPLATFPWSTNASSTGPVTPAGSTNFTKSNAFPLWSQNVGNGTWSWIAQ